MNKYLAILSVVALIGIPVTSLAATAALSQCDNCTAVQAQRKISAANGLFVGQTWYSIDSATGGVYKFTTDILPRGEQPVGVAQRTSTGQWIYFHTQVNDGAVDAIARSGKDWYNTDPVGWIKEVDLSGVSIDQGMTAAQRAMATQAATAAGKLTAMGESAPNVYPDPNVNVYNAIDAGAPEHNDVVAWARQQNSAKFQTLQQRVQDTISSIASFKYKDVELSLGRDWTFEMYVTVPFQDGSKLSLQYTKEGYQTDLRFGESQDSHHNSVPVRSDQLGGAGGLLHTYDFSPRPWAANPADLNSFRQRAERFFPGSASGIGNGPRVGCASTPGLNPVCTRVN